MASRASGDLVPPLLQYYGVLSLSRGLVLFLSPSLRESGLSKSHGLSAKGWGEVLAGGIQHLGELEVELGGGTFRQLLDATGNEERSCIHQAPYPNKLILTRRRSFTAPQGKVIKAKALLSRITHLQEIYERTFDERLACLRGFVFNLSFETQTDIDILPGRHGLPQEAEIRALFSIPAEIELRITDQHNFMPQLQHWNYRIQHKSLEELLNVLPSLENTDSDHVFLVAPFNGGLYLSVLVKLFVTSYFLGMLVRYYPTNWLALQSRQKGDFMLPMVREAVNLIDDQFPTLLLDELDRE